MDTLPRTMMGRWMKIEDLLRIFGLKSMLHSGSKKKRTISTLLRKEVEVDSWREEWN
jgi:hypothetical protein